MIWIRISKQLNNKGNNRKYIYLSNISNEHTRSNLTGEMFKISNTEQAELNNLNKYLYIYQLQKNVYNNALKKDEKHFCDVFQYLSIVQPLSTEKSNVPPRQRIRVLENSGDIMSTGSKVCFACYKCQLQILKNESVVSTDTDLQGIISDLAASPTLTCQQQNLGRIQIPSHMLLL